MHERQRPSWLRVVGGTDYENHSNDLSARNGGGSVESKDVFDASELVELWLQLTENMPSDLDVKIKTELVKSARMTVGNWSEERLFNYLNQSDKIWKKPSFTKAVIDEVTVRMRSGKLSLMK